MECRKWKCVEWNGFDLSYFDLHQTNVESGNDGGVEKEEDGVKSCKTHSILLYIMMMFSGVYVIGVILMREWLLAWSSSPSSPIWTLDPNRTFPSVFILPLPSGVSHPSKADCVQYYRSFFPKHGQDMLFHCFLLYFYPMTIVNVTTVTHVDIFYLPLITLIAGSHDLHYSLSSWGEIDRFLHNFVLNNSIANLTHFNLDKTFCIDTNPTETMFLQNMNSLRYVQDIHHFRSDEILTPNGRDIFIPYVLLPYPKQSTIEHKQFVLMAPLREAGGNGETYRLFRTRLYHQLQKLRLSNALITINMTTKEFDQGMYNSLFCLILPGDTPSTAKLYKAIARGCIPVIFLSYIDQLPFNSFIDWSSFSLYFYKDDINYFDRVSIIVQTIYNISEDCNKLARMHASLAKHAILFDYRRVEWPSVYHLALLSLFEITQRSSQMEIN